MNRWIFCLGLLGLALAILGGFYLAMREKPVLVDTAAVKRDAMQVTIREEGITQVKDVYTVSAPIAGHLDRTTLEEGSEVIAHQTVIARIHPPEPPFLDERTLAELTAAAEAARSAVALAEVEHAAGSAGGVITKCSACGDDAAELFKARTKRFGHARAPITFWVQHGGQSRAFNDGLLGSLSCFVLLCYPESVEIVSCLVLVSIVQCQCRGGQSIGAGQALPLIFIQRANDQLRAGAGGLVVEVNNVVTAAVVEQDFWHRVTLRQGAVIRSH